GMPGMPGGASSGNKPDGKPGERGQAMPAGLNKLRAISRTKVPGNFMVIPESFEKVKNEKKAESSEIAKNEKKAEISEKAKDEKKVESSEKAKEEKKAESSEKSANKQTVKKTRSGGPTFAQAFIFKNVDEVITFSKLVDEKLPMESILYKNEKNGEYILLLMTKTMLAEDFGMVCSIANEYATMLYMIPSTLEYFKEHYKLVIAKDTIKKLKQV
ncbi:MAG TPA: hypothetical protein DEO62_00200, partial [Lachnospiraceae bacterium]|nr:hypothetical protein [Lachnospiraceae bacterium]